ncbi:MAG: membrane dipeptidase [Ignavibacterium sp.]|nr:membrane dipeptidase [Ignavibacterium sp.]MDW8375305.1 membrane dipeptidase [Ignavibacteriales bacterium]
MKKFLIALLAFYIQFTFAQNVTGFVRDLIKNTPISNVKVKIKNLATGIEDSVYTNSNGQWIFNLATSVGEDDLIADQFHVFQNYPNPFGKTVNSENPQTKINFSISQDDNVEIYIHNVLGELVDFKNEFLTSGIYSILYQGKGSPGIYFYTIKTSNYSETKKMIQLDGSKSDGGIQRIYRIGDYDKLSKSNVTSLYRIIYSKITHIEDTVQVELSGGESLMKLLKSFHHHTIMLDLHNDVLERMVADTSYRLRNRNSYNHTDIPRLKEGGVDLQFFAVWVSPTQYTNFYQQALNMLNIFQREMNDNQNSIAQARNWNQADSIIKQNKIAAVIGVEGGHHIEDSIEKLVNLYNAGMRYLTITWNNSTSWAVSAADSRSTTVGLSDFGRQVIRKLDSLGVIIDVSHTGIKTIQDILQVTTKPIIASHSGARALRNNTRNLYDWQIQDIANTGGVIGVVFYPPFLNGTNNATIQDVVNHIDYIKNLVGIDHVAIGSDFDGIGVTPLGLEDVSKFPALTEALFNRGYSREDVEKILYKNFRRVFQQVCR